LAAALPSVLDSTRTSRIPKIKSDDKTFAARSRSAMLVCW
jgi:hypothetical protein